MRLPGHSHEIHSTNQLLPQGRDIGPVSFGGQVMQEHERGLAALLVVGALIGLGKLLVSNERLTLRLAMGRAILGSATSTVAGVVLTQMPDMPLPALVGIGAGMGILGAQYLESWIRQRADRLR